MGAHVNKGASFLKCTRDAYGYGPGIPREELSAQLFPLPVTDLRLELPICFISVILILRPP